MRVQLKLDSLSTNKRVLVAILSVILVLFGFGSWCLLDSGVRSVLLYRSPYTFQIQPGPGSQPVTQRLVLVIVDGLQSRDFEAMLAVKDVAGRGVAVALRGSRGLAPIPASTVLMTGALPEISGVVTNWFSDRVMIGSLWSSARRAGLNTAILGDSRWEPLFGHLVTQGIYRGPGDKVSNTDINNIILKDAITEITEGKSQLVLVSFLSERDLTNSPTNFAQQRITREEAVASIDMRLNDILEAIDLSSATVVFVSGGSHLTQDTPVESSKNTGDAFLVATGAGIVTPEDSSEEIQWVSGRPVDVAPTCASLLGCPVPTHSQGEAILSMLDLAHHTLSEVAIRQTAARAKFAAEYMNTLNRQTNEDWPVLDAFLLHNDGHYQDAFEAALGIDREITSALQKARSGLVKASRMISVPILAATAGLLIIIATMLLQGDMRSVSSAAIGVFCYFTAYYGLMFVKGAVLSPSAILKLSEFTHFYHSRIMDSVACMTLTAVIIGWAASGRKEQGKNRQGFLAGLTGFCFIALALVAHIAVFIVTEGSAYVFYLPDIHKGFRCFMYLIQLMVAGILSPILAGLSEGVLVFLSRAGSSRPRRL